MEAAQKPRVPKQRVVVESKEQQSIVGWLSLVLLILLIGLCVVGYAFRDRLFNKPQSTAEVAEKETQQANSVIEEKYQTVRKGLIEGDATAAQDAFRQLGEQQPPAPQPLQNWIAFHEGFSALLAGHLQDAREVFKTLRARGMFATDPANKTLANFFLETARLSEDEKPLPPSVVKNYSRTNVEALSLFVFALKDWELGQFADANQILAAFISSTPQEPFAWISDYKPIAQKYAAEFGEYQKVNAAAAGADTAEKRSAVSAQIKALSATAHGKMVSRLEELQGELDKKTADETAAATQMQTAHHDAEEKLLAAARAKYATSVADYKFSDARAAARSAQVSDSDFVKQRDALVKKAEWLMKFKTILTNDLNAAGYPESFRRKNNMPVMGGIKKATNTQMQEQTPYGFIPVPWSEVPVPTLLAMANYFAKNAASPDLVADRNWLSGVFACELGMAAEGRVLLTQAAQGKPDYRDQLGLFFDAAQ